LAQRLSMAPELKLAQNPLVVHRSVANCIFLLRQVTGIMIRPILYLTTIAYLFTTGDW
jgi:hypothetical protein